MTQIHDSFPAFGLRSFEGHFQILTLPDYLVLGSDPECGPGALYGKGTEPRHARLERKNGIFTLKDLRSELGTFVNGVRIQEAFLQDGDIISLGAYELCFEKIGDLAAFPLTSKNEVWNQELQLLSNVAKKNFPVLLLGPSGTGKDVIAQKIHETSERKLGPFLSVNCSALTETLVESELFGHVKGSFTGAVNDRKGAFEAARGGTLFLDEIGDLPYPLQSKLLRALENSEIRPVGSDKNVKTDVRIIAATHQHLLEKISSGSFRQDLYYRLNVITVSPPALAHRMEDFESLLYEFAKQLRVRFSFGAIQKLKLYDWPGNIREVKNVVCRASAYFPRQEITEKELEKIIPAPAPQRHENQEISHGGSEGTLPVIKEIERQMIIQRLVANKGNQRRTAKDLGMPKSTLHDRLKYYNIDIGSYKYIG
ncbi:MAG: sigma 54-interacting transcriptional regulator [Bdellovibrionota bacterium]